MVIDQMVIVLTEKYTLFHDEWNLPAAAFWLGWNGMCWENMLTGSLVVPSLLKARSPVGQRVDGMFSLGWKVNLFILFDLVLVLPKFDFSRNVK